MGPSGPIGRWIPRRRGSAGPSGLVGCRICGEGAMPSLRVRGGAGFAVKGLCRAFGFGVAPDPRRRGDAEPSGSGWRRIHGEGVRLGLRAWAGAGSTGEGPDPRAMGRRRAFGFGVAPDPTEKGRVRAFGLGRAPDPRGRDRSDLRVWSVPDPRGRDRSGLRVWSVPDPRDQGRVRVPGEDGSWHLRVARSAGPREPKRVLGEDGS
jgi:hypothetical protein